MDTKTAVDAYYAAWMRGDGDFSAVPLAADLTYTGPVANIAGADAFRQMTSQAAPPVTRFAIRHQYIDGETACTIIDWEMALPVAPMTAAEILTVRDGRIIHGENIYDGEALRTAMAG